MHSLSMPLFRARGAGCAFAAVLLPGTCLVSANAARPERAVVSLNEFEAYVAMMPKEKIGVVVLTNSQKPIAGDTAAFRKAIALRALDQALGVPAREWDREFLLRAAKAEQESRAREAALQQARLKAAPSLPLQQYIGDYENRAQSAGIVKIRVLGKQLALSFDGKGAFSGTLEPWHQDMFRLHMRNPAALPIYPAFTITRDGRAGALSLFGANFERLGAGDTVGARHDAKVDALVARFEPKTSPGCAISVFDEGKLVFKKSYGWADVERRVPVTDDTLYYMASISKQFTSLGAVKLIEDGKLRLDDDVRRWIPELPDYGTPITIDMLMHHNSGIRDGLTQLQMAGVDHFDELLPADMLRMLVQQKGLDFTPGTRYRYSNGAYFLLAQVVERASGMKFHDFMRKRILDPLGMRDSYFRFGPNPAGAKVAHGYIGDVKQGFTLRDTYPGFSGSGGLMSSTNDMAKYIHDFYVGHKVWTARTRAMMLKPGLLTNGEPVDTGQGLGYGAGVRVGTLRGQAWIGHAGGQEAFVSFLGMQPELKTAALAMCNRRDVYTEALVRDLLDTFYGESLSGAWPKATARPADNPTIPVPDELIAQLGVGTARYYSPEMDATYVLERVGEELVIKVTSRFAKDKRLVAAGSLRMETPEVLRAGYIRLRLERGDDGNVVGFLFETSPTPGIRFTRQ